MHKEREEEMFNWIMMGRKRVIKKSIKILLTKISLLSVVSTIACKEDLKSLEILIKNYSGEFIF